MANYKLTVENNNNFEVILFVNKVKWFLLTPFYLFGLMVLFLPIFFVVSNMIDSEIGYKIHFGHFVLIALSMRMTYYFLKVILWNLYGKEVIKVENGILIHFYDFKYFKRYSENNSKQIGGFLDLINSDENPNQKQILIFRFIFLELRSLIKKDNIEIHELKIEMFEKSILPGL